MKQSPGAMRHTRYAPVLTLFLSIFLGLNLTLKAQPTWPPTFPSITEISIGNVTTPDWVNMDMHDYFKAGSIPPSYFGTVVYDDVNTNQVYIVSFDSQLGTDVRVINDARHPDVVVWTETTCPGTASGCTGAYYTDCSRHVVCVVYEDWSTSPHSIKMYVCLVGIVGSFFTPYILPNIYTISNPVNGAAYPHIDGAKKDLSCFNNYNAINSIVVTWTEDNSGNKIYARYGDYIVSPSMWAYPNMGSIQLIDNGEMSDVAFSYDAGTTDHMAYFVYHDGAGTVKHATWDPANTTVNISTLESGLIAVTAPPRIEALNVNDLVTPSTDRYWQAVAEVLNPGPSHEIHGYDISGITNFSSPLYMGNNPLAGNSGYSPAVAVGVGPSGTSGYLGNDGYTVGWNINNSELHPLWLDATTSGNVLAGYEQVNQIPLVNSYGPGKNLLAFTNSSNSGNYLGSAWYNPDDQNVYMKVITGVSFAFKPTGLSDVNAETGISLSPNPAHNVLNLSATVKGDYSITDIAGRVLLSGTLKGTEIDISSLPAGLYLLQIDRQGSTGKLKFVKQ